MRIKVLNENSELYIESCQEQNLLTLLLRNKVFLPSVCHGNGTCGKCKIKVVSGDLSITEADRRMLSEAELKQGIRLACEAKMENEREDLCIEIIGKSEEEIVVEGISGIKESKEDLKKKKCFLAIDIGTTTIAMALIDEENGEVLDTYTSLNHQRKYGADVISRIVAANNGKAEELKKTIEEDLCRGIEALIGEKYEIINKIIIAGNTTMVHLLMGYSCESLGKYPFESEHLELMECKMKDCIRYGGDEKYLHVPVTILPGISAFVGGDVVAGVLTCEGFEGEELCLLIDLGTNGEMVLGNKNKILATSAAAGPAFEGGNIICGMASIPGSICQVKIQNQRAVVRTIKNEMPPVGICGSGLISIMAQLKVNQLIKRDGELIIPYNEKGFPLWIFENGEKIALYQKDVREFQMAKAAIRAGIDILMEEYGCVPEEIKNVYVAGGFGKAISIEDILTIGMMPEEFRDKISIIGNSALQGTVCFGKDIETRKQIETICRRAKNITLSEKTEFQKKYLKYMEL